MTYLALWRTLKRFLPWIAAIAALIGIWLYIGNLKSTVREQQGAINVLTVKLDTEEQARRKDVAGLVALSKGLATATLDTKADAAIMGRTIDASNPTPSSPALRSLIDGLRASDRTKPTPPTGANR